MATLSDAELVELSLAAARSGKLAERVLKLEAALKSLAQSGGAFWIRPVGRNADATIADLVKEALA